MDRALHRRARREEKSLNRIILDILGAAAEMEADGAVHHDLDGLIGTWKEDPAFDAALAGQDQVDSGFWG